MILDQSVLLGVADIHDRHRDMRLDVDNMSYEVVSIFLTSTSLSVFENSHTCFVGDRSYWLWKSALVM